MAGAQVDPSYPTPSHGDNAGMHHKEPGRPTDEDNISKPQLAIERSIPVDISDLSQQVWVLQGETLVAVPRTDNVKPADVAFMPCTYQESLDHSKGNAIYMGLENPEMCLFCENTEEKPTLQMKAQKLDELYHNPEPVKPFLFYHSQDGPTSTFESVEFPDYFIASSEKDQPLFLTNKIGENNISFYFASKD